MTSRFLSSLAVQRVPAGWELVYPLVFESESLKRVIEVPVGFFTNFASVPRLPFAYLFFAGVADEAATIHDYAYSGALRITRKQADTLFHEAMKASGTSAWRRYPMTWAVRLFGGTHYTPHQESIAP